MLPSEAKEWKHQWVMESCPLLEVHPEPLSYAETKKVWDWGAPIPLDWGHQEPPKSYTYRSI